MASKRTRKLSIGKRHKEVPNQSEKSDHDKRGTPTPFDLITYKEWKRLSDEKQAEECKAKSKKKLGATSVAWRRSKKNLTVDVDDRVSVQSVWYNPDSPSADSHGNDMNEYEGTQQKQGYVMYM
jgi:hypothetical protein